MIKSSEKENAIKIWVDETFIENKKNIKTIVGYLITNTYTEEHKFFNELTKARKKNNYNNVLHGQDLKQRIKQDDKALKLLDDWLEIFRKSDNVYFHCFLYNRQDRYIAKSKSKNYEHYFAKQSVFALAHRMKKIGVKIETIFSDVHTLFVLFDRRGSNTEDLSNAYKKEITQQIEKQAKRNSKSNDLTVRFSFVSSECFDGIQFTDCFLYIIRQKELGEDNCFVDLFDKHFIYGLDNDIKEKGYKKIYEFDKKFNIFEAY